MLQNKLTDISCQYTLHQAHVWY